ncbi:SusD/RagB family nutrient-binding outer membrane lipoprotein [Bacteroides sp. 519]|uniref:SusD/RagB family nutrient-binding outer membrane lipoprotein n=1 Tax=Bacteroides sp. 519 TaxID=2302937 RepID=UPI001EF3A993|nr:SusD/RagB family nutrient-binding outer membrane lipoprotein [Bacteroides sp. 519]NDV57894.1 SusD/RagB family nutrient-binding outer membrane lipoprotein [Bacteroides sp. 519]
MKPLINKFIVILTASMLITAGCTSSFDDLNTNPDKTTQVRSSMLATGLLLSVVQNAHYWKNDVFVKRMFWGEQIDDLQYNKVGRGSFGWIRQLTDAQRMVELAPEGQENAYTGLFYYLKGWTFYKVTMDMGDVPYSQTLHINEYKYPVYDAQKDVFKGILDDLEKADEYFSKATTAIEGDPYYDGDVKLWRKATNVLRLKVLMALQKRAEDTPDLKVKETFAKIVSEGNLFKSNADNLQVVYSDVDNQKNPYHETETRSINVFAGTTMLIDPLKEFEDYRLFYYLAPAQAMTDPLYLPEGQELLQPSDWRAYNGLNVAGVFDVEKKKITERMHNRPNNVYRVSYAGVPCISLGYANMNFVLAEAAERGWITGSAKEYYEEGIRASFQYVRATVPAEYNNGVEITDAYIESYLNADKTAYNTTGTSTDRLHQIWLQNYLAGYFHMNGDTYYEYRRTGYPEWPINPDTNRNSDNKKIPMRYLYPERENSYNKDAFLNALNSQWDGRDDTNHIMWVLK